MLHCSLAEKMPGGLFIVLENLPSVVRYVQEALVSGNSTEIRKKEIGTFRPAYGSGGGGPTGKTSHFMSSVCAEGGKNLIRLLSPASSGHL